ncbi:MAG: formate dehydrogenase [Beijerinckiaceae bacterium]
MTDQNPEEPGTEKLPRRGFLKALGLGAGAAAAGVTADAATAPALASEARNERTKARYKETDHVRAFYRTNRY